ncbi:Scr1 family TA system antitoxin-like transcriptional regulator [Streptomyces sp. NPDC050617]|uniref:Scr1 family TA system antitoxin-like transcriptional regulator n=1 Tax=Streptomyces sp. NPDC050617 TaxID=3154628 RepID=UPI003414664E
MREQLRRLLDVSEMPNVTLQVMPLDATPHLGNAGSFSLVGFPGPMSECRTLWREQRPVVSRVG